MKIHVSVRQDFRCAYVEMCQKEGWSPENRFCQVRRNWRLIPDQRVQSWEFLREWNRSRNNLARENFMASTRNHNQYDNRRVKRRQAYYEDGNAARRLEEVPVRPKKKLSKTAQKNRAKSTNMGKGYIVFLFLICALATGACVHYIRLTALVTKQKRYW